MLRRRVICTPLCCVCAPTTPARPPLLRHLNSVPSRSVGLLSSGSAYHAWLSMIIVHRTLGRRLLPPQNPVAPHVAHRPLCVRAQRLQAWGGGSRAIPGPTPMAASDIPPLTPPVRSLPSGIPPTAGYIGIRSAKGSQSLIGHHGFAALDKSNLMLIIHSWTCEHSDQLTANRISINQLR